MLALVLAMATFAGQGTPPVAPATPPAKEPKVAITDVKLGKGETVVRGDRLTLDYTGSLDSGKVFDSSKKAGKPFVVFIGVGDVIRGWDLGLIGMREGGVRKLKIPAELAYGTRGIPGTIPPGATLDFTIELHKVAHLQKKVEIEVTKAGNGTPVAWDDTIKFNFVAKNADGKTFYDSSEKSPEGVKLVIGKQAISLPGLIFGILGMKTGEKRHLTIPAELALGDKGNPAIGVKPGAPVLFDVELLSIEPKVDTSGGRDARR